MDTLKNYSNDEITIHWNSNKCTHAAKCVIGLPQVFKSKEKPWISIENATTLALKSQINECPSGALSYSLKHGKSEKV